MENYDIIFTYHIFAYTISEYVYTKNEKRSIFMNKANEILQQVKKIVVGNEDNIAKIMMAILAQGHVLMEDIPGVGKTTMANAFAKAMGLQATRMQFTVDVLPSDIVGFTMIDPANGKTVLHKGAIFCNIFLADEINRTSSKTQAALLEVMEERQITVDGITQKALEPFIVIATQNPTGSAGTQLLPESQLDRFMIRIHFGYPTPEEELEILRRKAMPQLIENVSVNAEDILQMQKECAQVYVHEDIYAYVVELVNATRHHEKIRQGASPRASIALVRMGQACAYLHQRDYVIPKDIISVFHDVCEHRILMHTMIDASKESIKCLDDILRQIPIPKGA